MVRTNVGTGDLIRTKYSNNLENYLDNYGKDYDVPIETVIETIKIANTFDIWYPENLKAKRTWNTALKEFKEYYVNSSIAGYEYLHDITGVKPEGCLKHLVDNEFNHICPYCGKDIDTKIDENGNVTLDRFFGIS